MTITGQTDLKYPVAPGSKSSPESTKNICSATREYGLHQCYPQQKQTWNK